MTTRRPDEWLSLLAAVALLILYAAMAPRIAESQPKPTQPTTISAIYRDVPASLTTLGGTAVDPHPVMPAFREFGCLETIEGCKR